MCIVTDQILTNAAWTQQIVTDVSRGKGDWAEVKASAQATLADWLKWQIGKRREGLLDAIKYASATKAAREADKVRAGWYSFAAYDHNHRNSKNWRGSNIVVIDADAKHGENEGPEYSFTADQLRERLKGLQFIALPSHSYTDEIPRWRIVIPLSEVVTDRKEYEAIARQLAWRLDGYVDPRSCTPEQLWFSMSAPKGEWDRRIKLVVLGD
ncbi:MAG: hypothetical protein M0Z99_30505 [Betaproteobacteria bacterium]|nr:hypothetical protein [Betaproteobacteria bacterium]